MGREYQKYEYCRSIGCRFIKPTGCIISSELCAAKHMHKWLIANDFEIKKKDKSDEEEK